MWINGQPQADIPGKQYNYTVVTNGTPVNPDVFEDMALPRTIFTTMRLTTRMWNCR